MADKRALLLFALLAFACTHAPLAPEERIRRYTVLMSTNEAGKQVVTERPSQLVIDFEFNDRGRGPKTHTVIRVGEDGLPVSMHTTGNDYFKQQIEERFDVENGVARWSNTAERMEAPAGGYYSSMYGPPEEAAVLARALLRNGGRLRLLPAGEASIRKVDESTVRDTPITAYEISGLGFSPFEVWLDGDLNLFGAVSSWSSTIREGFEGDARALVEAQDARARSRLEEVAKQVTDVPTMRRLTLMNARIFDPRTGTVSDPTSIHVQGNRITALGGVQERSAADVLDAGGRIVLPGLWDMHTHIGDVDGLLNIASGITSVRDLGNDSDAVMALKQKFDSSAAVGPRVVLAGLVDGPGEFKGPTNILAANEEEARKAVDFFAARGYEGLKIYSSIAPELVPVLTSYAHQRGLRVSGHVPAGMRAVDAVNAGYDEIQHANMLFLNFMPDVKDTRTPARFTEVAKRGAELDLRSDEVQSFIALLKQRGVVVDPTVTIFEDMFTARAGAVSPAYAAVADRFPPQVRRYFLAGGLPVDESTDSQYRASFQRMLDLVGELHRAGVRLVAGTDALAGFSLHRELELYARAGIPNAEVLRIATLGPAEILGRAKDLGTIEPGKLADFIVVDGDPLSNMSDIRKVTLVVKDGLVYRPEELLARVGVRGAGL